MADLRTTITIDLDVYLGLVDQHGTAHRRATERDLAEMGYVNRNGLIDGVDVLLARACGLSDLDAANPEGLGLDDAPVNPLRALLHDLIRQGEVHVHELGDDDRRRLSNALTGYTPHPEAQRNNALAAQLGDLRAELLGGQRPDGERLNLLVDAANALRTP